MQACKAAQETWPITDWDDRGLSTAGVFTAGFLAMDCLTGWWFGTYFVFPYIGKNNPN